MFELSRKISISKKKFSVRENKKLYEGFSKILIIKILVGAKTETKVENVVYKDFFNVFHHSKVLLL